MNYNPTTFERALMFLRRFRNSILEYVINIVGSNLNYNIHIIPIEMFTNEIIYIKYNSLIGRFEEIMLDGELLPLQDELN